MNTLTSLFPVPVLPSSSVPPLAKACQKSEGKGPWVMWSFQVSLWGRERG